MHIIPYLQPTMQGIMSSHCSWHSFTHTMGHCRSYRYNAKISKLCSGLAASDSLRLRHFFCLHMLAQTNNQTCKEASYILSIYCYILVTSKKKQLTIQLLNESVVSLHQNRAFGILSFPCRSSIHGEIPLVQAALSSILPHHRIDGLIRIHQGVMKPLLTWRIKNGENPSRSSRRGTVPVIPLRLRTWMKTWLTCLTQLEDIIHIIAGYL